jgi:hypothetical protein
LLHNEFLIINKIVKSMASKGSPLRVSYKFSNITII